VLRKHSEHDPSVTKNCLTGLTFEDFETTHDFSILTKQSTFHNTANVHIMLSVMDLFITRHLGTRGKNISILTTSCMADPQNSRHGLAKAQAPLE
jgi:hypothetical protein